MRELEQRVNCSVVILTRDSARTLKKCMDAVMFENPSEIIAVDRRSTDSTIAILRRYGVRILVDNIGSLGFSRQLGAIAARNDYVAFVDSDTVLTPGCIPAMIHDIKSNGWVGAQATIRSAEDVSYWQRMERDRSAQFYRTRDRSAQFYRTGEPRTSFIGTSGETTSFIGTSVTVFKRKILLSCPFDPMMRESYEDTDINRRLIRKGYRLGVSSDAIAYHYDRREFSAFVKQRINRGIGAVRMAMKYHERWQLLSPLIIPFSLTIRNLASSRMKYVPFWTADGVARFIGILLGISKVKRENNERQC